MRSVKLVVIYGATLLVVLFGLSLMLIGSDNPLWQFDRYVVEGTFTGNSCTLMLDGRPILGDAALGPRVIIPGDHTARMEGPPGAAMDQGPTQWPRSQGIFCRGLSVTIPLPLTHSGVGSYAVVKHAVALGPGQAAVELSSDDVDQGWWPFSFGVATLVGHEGALTITSMTDSTVSGVFRAIARRHGPGFGG